MDTLSGSAFTGRSGNDIDADSSGILFSMVSKQFQNSDGCTCQTLLIYKVFDLGCRRCSAACYISYCADPVYPPETGIRLTSQENRPDRVGYGADCHAWLTRESLCAEAFDVSESGNPAVFHAGII